jgi:GT2 family glycosyltransferase
MAEWRASVIIPTWNGYDLLRDALDSLRRQTFTDAEIIVVDNGSSDGTSELIAVEYPEVRVIQLAENRGFAVAVNEGIRASSGEVVVLMNNDTIAEPGWLKALVETMSLAPDIAACASRMLIASAPDRIDSAGDRMGLFASAVGHGEPDGPRFTVAREVLTASAGAAAYRRSALDEVGLFDERFFAYFEDVDLGLRLRLAGYRCMYAPEARILHVGSATASRIPEIKFFLLMRNSLFIFFQYMPPERLIWAPAVLAWPMVRAVLDRQPQRVAIRCIAAFLADLPTVLRRRRQAVGGRRVSWVEFRCHLSKPLVRQARSARG